MKNIKSQAHIEVILSFILFFASVILIFYFLNPMAKTEDKNPAAERVIGIVIDELTFEFGRLGVVSEVANCEIQPSSCCYYFGPSTAKDSNYYGVTLKYIETYPDSDKKKIYIYFSDKINFLQDSPNYDNSCSSKFWLGEFQNESLIYYERLKEVATLGGADATYQTLKTTLGINYDFSYDTRDIGGNINGDLSFSRKIPRGVQVVAREFPIRVINNSGHINEYIFNIRVW